MSTLDYFSRVNLALLALIPPDAKVVLEIGCGAGALCEAYRRINPGVEWIGVEKNREAAKKAAHRGVEVINQDVEDEVLDLPNFAIDPGLDCIILGDILEHLRDPWDVMDWIAALIDPGAQVLASIPNVQHFSIIYQLLIGEWNYADEGLMDHTHLRWFTQKSIREMFDQAGLHVFEIRGIRAKNDELGWQEWLKIAEDIHVDGFDLTKTAPLQYLIRAVKPVMLPNFGPTPETGTGFHTSKIKPLHIHAIGDGTICERPRIHEPFAMLSTIPGVRCTFSNIGLSGADPVPDILIQQRFRRILPSQWNRLERSLVIAEIDDDPCALVGMCDQNYAPLRAVHAIQCSTEVVAETCRQWNPNVMVFENQIAELPPWEEKNKGLPKIFFGALNRENDWKPIMPAINRVLADNPGVWMHVVHDQKFFEALECKWKSFRAFCPWPEYRSILRSCDIALLPLEDTRFNRHKSDLKFLECAAEGVLVLASPTVYRDTVLGVHGPLGETYESPEDFKVRLNRLIKDHSKSELAYVYVRDHRLLSHHFRKRHEWYLDLIARRADLHRSLIERCPELIHSDEPYPVGCDGVARQLPQHAP